MNPSPQNPYAAPNNQSDARGVSSQARSRMTPVGIALIIVGSIGLICMSIYFILSLFYVGAEGAGAFEAPPEITDEAERIGFKIGAIGAFVAALVFAFLQIFVILSGVCLLRAK